MGEGGCNNTMEEKRMKRGCFLSLFRSGCMGQWRDAGMGEWANSVGEEGRKRREGERTWGIMARLPHSR